MISRCFGDAVFPMITIIVIIMFGINTYRNLQNDNAVKATNADSSAMAFVRNFGFPIWMPVIPITLIENKITIIIFVVVVDALFSKFIEMILD